jgi:3-oxoacyl-[acyl-carrier protein] reductase
MISAEIFQLYVLKFNKKITMNLSLKGKKILITGASGGIGKAVSKAIAHQGGLPIMHYNSNFGSIKGCLEELTSQGLTADSIQFNINDEDEVKRKIAELKKRHGTIDGLVNNAGILSRGFVATQSLNVFRDVINTNLIGNFTVLKYVSQLMISQKNGNIVNVSSLAGTMGLKGQSAYSASKAGMNALTTVSAKELAAYQIRVNSVAPGYIQTGMLEKPTENDQKYQEVIPLMRFGRDCEVASTIVFLLSEASSYITGQSIIIDGGLSIAM